MTAWRLDAVQILAFSLALCHKRSAADISTACVEPVSHMTLFRRLAIFGLLLIAATSGAAIPGARAQSVEIYNGAVLSMDGLNLTVGGCTLTTASLSSCSSSDGIYLQGISTGRGTVTYEVIGAGGGAVFSLAQSSGVTDTLQFTLTVATNQPNSTVGSGDLTLNGSTYNSSTKHVTATQSFAANSPSPAPAGLTSSSLYLNYAATTQSTGAVSFTNNPLLSSFQVTTTLSANPSSGSVVKLNSAVETFKTVPEPASITVLLLGIGGLAAARRRRSVS
jgi:PEP-CTERM motif